MRKSWLVVCLCTLGGSSGAVCAQEVERTADSTLWDLPGCVRYAQMHSPEVEGAELDLRSARIQERAAWWRFSPTASANAGVGFNFGRAIDYGSNSVSNDLQSTNISIGANLSLFEGLARVWNLRAEQLGRASAEANREVVLRQVAISVTQSFFDLLFQQEVLGLRQSQAEEVARQLELAQKRVDAGSLAEGALLDLRAQLSAEEGQRVESENLVASAELQLRQLLNLEGTQPMRIASPAPTALDSLRTVGLQPFEAFAQSVIANHPSMQKATLGEQQAQYNVKASKSGWLPRLSLSASYGSGSRHFLKQEGHPPEDAFSRQLRDNASQSVNLNLQVPIWDGYATGSRVAQARIGLRRAQLVQDNTRQQLYKALQRAHADAVNTLRRWTSSEEELSANREAFRWASQKLAAGAITAYDYGQAKTKLKQAEVRHLQAKYEYMLKAMILRIYAGQ